MSISVKRKLDRLFISFSGGKTSAYMTDRILRELRNDWSEIVVLFANTGEEHEKTLEYVDKCDRHYGFNVVWVESVFDPKLGAGTSHRIVDFNTATRGRRLFYEMSEKYGIPNNQFPHCTRELKLQPMTSYLRSLGWGKGTYNTAIGIRADEIDRMSIASMNAGCFYPLIDMEIRKPDVIAWEALQPVRLGIPEHLGNCTWCWKKSDRKLATAFLEDRHYFDTPYDLEVDHRNSGRGAGDRRLFRHRRTVPDIAEIAYDPGFIPFVDGAPWKDELDTGGSCSDSCEIGVDGQELEGEELV